MEMGELQILQELENDLSTIRMTERTSCLRKAAEELKGTESADLARDISWELQIFDLYTPYPAFPRPEGKERFQPMIGWSDGTGYPDLDQLVNDDAAIAYYRMRADQTTNLLHKARYSDFLWEALRKRGESDAHLYARKAITAYLDCVPIYLKAKGYLEMADALPRTVELALSLSDLDLARDVRRAIMWTLQRLPRAERPRWVLDLGNMILIIWRSKLQAAVDRRQLKAILRMCEEGQQAFNELGQFFLQRDILRLGALVLDELGDSEQAFKWKLRVAQSLEEEAKLKEQAERPVGGGLVASHFFEEAIHEYLKLLSLAGDDKTRNKIRRKIEGLKVDVQRTLQKAENEMGRIEQTIEVPRDKLEELVEPLLKLEPNMAFRAIAQDSSLLPDPEEIRTQAQAIREKSVFRQFAPTRVIRHGRVAGEYTVEEKDEEFFNFQMSVLLRVQMMLLDYIFSRLKEAGPFFEATLSDYLAQWSLLDKSDLELIEVGVHRYFDEDYVSAIHILTPRVEKVLKGMFATAGVVPLAIPNKHRMTEVLLGSFLARPEVKRVLGDRIWLYLNYTLVDEMGLNLRNDVAHGWIAKAQCNRYLAQLLIHIFLLLTRFTLTEAQQAGNGDSG
jgi:hypothetical protein